MIDTSKIKTVILLMFENRSFDHMLGHLSLENIKPEVNGLRAPVEKYKNIYNTKPFYPYTFEGCYPLPGDIPHEKDFVDTQLAWHELSGKFLMDGFVESYANFSQATFENEAPPMIYFPSSEVPITSFLAQNFCTCDNWFCPIPTSTQPNRTMALCGDSNIDVTGIQYISAKNNLFDWLTDNQVNWKVYHDYLTFFILYPGLWDKIFGKNFSSYRNFYNDWNKKKRNTDPQLIIIEPAYQDAPHINHRPNDNHAPLAIGWGEEFLRNVYETVISNKLKWEETMLIIYYDEHGGFYDHVPPPPIPYTTTSSSPFVFKSLGPRIPGIIVSPFVEKGSVCHELFDHTSVLQLLAEIFTPGRSFSKNVGIRKKAGIQSLLETITTEVLSPPPLPPSQPIPVNSILGESLTKEPAASETMRQSFENASLELMKQRPADVKRKFPELFQWKNAADQRRL
jgi:phospholipase C